MSDRQGRVLFGQSYFLRFDPKLWQAMQPYPPLGTLYAAAYLRQRGYDVAVFDAMLAGSEEEWAQALDRHRPRFAVLYEDNFNYLSKMCLLRMRQAAFRMIEMARQRGCTVILCGADATDHADDYLTRGADFVLLGEGEVTLGELLDRLTGRTDVSFSAIAGLAYYDAETRGCGDAERDAETRRRGDAVNGSSALGAEAAFSTDVSAPLEAESSETLLSPRPRVPASQRLHINPRRPDIRDLNALPFPARDLIDMERYRAIWLERHGYFSMNLVTTRGCPFHCNWCAKPIWGQRYNSRSPENVAAEMRALKETYHPDHLWFADDILGLKPGWLARFAESVRAQDALIPFKCLSRVDLLLRAGEVEALARAGAQTVWVGAESGSQKVLDAMDKGTRVEQIVQARRLLRAAGIQVGFFLQFGYPGETRADIERTLQMVRDCDPDDIGISVSYAMPGTKFYAAVREQLGEKKNWQDSGDMAMLFHGAFSTGFYRKLHSVVHKEFRARRAWRVLKASFRPGASLPWPVRARTAARLAYNLAALPLARLQLNLLAAVPQNRRPAKGSARNRGSFSSDRLNSIPPQSVPLDSVPLPHMAPEAAARPTAQDDP